MFTYEKACTGPFWKLKIENLFSTIKHQPIDLMDLITACTYLLVNWSILHLLSYCTVLYCTAHSACTDGVLFVCFTATLLSLLPVCEGWGVVWCLNNRLKEWEIRDAAASSGRRAATCLAPAVSSNLPRGSPLSYTNYCNSLIKRDSESTQTATSTLTHWKPSSWNFLKLSEKAVECSQKGPVSTKAGKMLFHPFMS